MYGLVEAWFNRASTMNEVSLDALRGLAAVLSVALHGTEMFRFEEEQTNITAVASPEDDPALPVLEKYKEFFRQAVDGIVVIDRDEKVVHINRAGEQITGYSRVGLVGRPLVDIVSEDDREALERSVARVRSTATPYTFDLNLVTTSGDNITVLISTNGVLEDQGVVILSFRDVSEARSLETQLRATTEFLELLVNTALEATIVTDRTGMVIHFNRAAERIFGQLAGSVIGKARIEELLSPETVQQLVELADEGRSSGDIPGAFRADVLNEHRGRVPVSVSADHLVQGGQITGLVVLVNDLTERHRMERRLAQTQEKLAETEKQALIAELAGTTAHELNQPLTSVMGYAELLKRRIADDEQRIKAVDTIISEAERMAEIVRKIGRITRYETKSYVGTAQILDLEKSSPDHS